MKKFTTKLLMSIIAVAFAFVALGTSTYAWFSMNETVTATGMEVGAKSNSTYLIISESNNLSTMRTTNPTTVAFTPDADSKVLPSKPIEESEIAADGVAINTTTIGQGKYFAYGNTAVTTATTAAVAANWYTASSHNPDNATTFEGSGDFHNLNTTSNDAYEFSKYVIKKTVYLALAEGSEDAYHLTVTPTISFKDENHSNTADITAVRVLVAVGDKIAVLSTASGTQNLYDGSVENLLSGDTVLTADIYIYYDGSQSVVKTTNSANLAEATIALAFNVALKPAA